MFDRLCPCSCFIPGCPCFIPGCPYFVHGCPCFVPGRSCWSIEPWERSIKNYQYFHKLQDFRTWKKICKTKFVRDLTLVRDDPQHKGAHTLILAARNNKTSNCESLVSREEVIGYGGSLPVAVIQLHMESWYLECSDLLRWGLILLTEQCFSDTNQCKKWSYSECLRGSTQWASEHRRRTEGSLNPKKGTKIEDIRKLFFSKFLAKCHRCSLKSTNCHFISKAGGYR